MVDHLPVNNNPQCGPLFHQLLSSISLAPLQNTYPSIGIVNVQRETHTICSVEMLAKVFCGGEWGSSSRTRDAPKNAQPKNSSERKNIIINILIIIPISTILLSISATQKNLRPHRLILPFPFHCLHHRLMRYSQTFS